MAYYSISYLLQSHVNFSNAYITKT